MISNKIPQKYFDIYSKRDIFGPKLIFEIKKTYKRSRCLLKLVNYPNFRKIFT